jgi:hypothetical protein
MTDSDLAPVVPQPLAAPPLAMSQPLATLPPTGPALAAPPPARRVNALAIVTMLLAFRAPVAGVIAGHLSLRQIGKNREDGRGFAIAGLVIGYSLIGIAVLVIVLLMIMGGVFVIALYAINH